MPPITPYRVTVFSEFKGELSCRYVRSYIEQAALESGRTLTGRERAALDAMDSAINEATASEIVWQRGDLLIVNNYTSLHARTEFVDKGERRRHLLRLWIELPGWRHVKRSLLIHGRNGIPHQPGKFPTN